MENIVHSLYHSLLSTEKVAVVKKNEKSNMIGTVLIMNCF